MSIVKVFGVPSFAGCREETSETIDQHNGPRALRKAFDYLVSGFNVPRDFDDIGDINTGATVSELIDAVEKKVLELRKNRSIPFIIGGAHTLTVGSLKALHQTDPQYSLIYFDAHPDIMPHAQINYGSSIYHAIKDGYLNPKNLAYVGIRQIENDEWALIRKHNIFHITSLDLERLSGDEVIKEIKAKLPPPYYLTLDLDCLDPSFAPGVTSPFPSGLTPREVLYITSKLCLDQTIGVEIVELSPINDRKNETAGIAALFLQTLSSVITESYQRNKG